MKKIFYIVLDGVGDLPISELQDKTPLESASTPCMDYLAKEGMQGVIYPVDKGVAPESDIAVIEANDAEKYIHSMPLFAKFWSDETKGFHRIIAMILPKSSTNDILRKLNNIIDELPEKTGILVYMQKIDYINGYLNL